jgi:hypothetical protein
MLVKLPASFISVGQLMLNMANWACLFWTAGTPITPHLRFDGGIAHFYISKPHIFDQQAKRCSSVFF